eukprot:GHVU01154356.1.p1 GENE.GHVU01154356.1~~GHVU01154356.1.p1  ORF type:complete len:292 (-),score=3.34 GHVU01154356.1:167-1042(-)
MLLALLAYECLGMRHAVGPRPCPMPQGAPAPMLSNRRMLATASLGQFPSWSRFARYARASPQRSKKRKTSLSGIGRALKVGSPDHRIQQELHDYVLDPPANSTVKLVGGDIRKWTITIRHVDNPLYRNSTFKLRVMFPRAYPVSPPTVYFLASDRYPPPRHSHVYTNGDICLNILGSDWMPMVSTKTVVVSLISMLAAATRESLPIDNASRKGSQDGQPRDVNFCISLLSEIRCARLQMRTHFQDPKTPVSCTMTITAEKEVRRTWQCSNSLAARGCIAYVFTTFSLSNIR